MEQVKPKPPEYPYPEKNMRKHLEKAGEAYTATRKEGKKKIELPYLQYKGLTFKELGKKIVITPGLGQCLFIFTSKDLQ